MLIFVDGFDHYGAVPSSGDRLREGVYAETNLGPGGGVTNANPRTGERALRINMGTNDAGVRRVLLSGASETVGAGFAFRLSSLPTDNRSLGLFQWRRNDNGIIASIWVTSTGQVLLAAGGRSGAEVGRSDPVVYAGAYQHFEAVMTPADVEVRINGVTVLSQAIEGDSCAQVKLGANGYPLSGATGVTMDVDDFCVWDGEGDANNDFLGDVKVYTRFPSSDGAVQEWTPSIEGNGYPMIDNVPPADATEYLSADDVSGGVRSTFGVADFPEEIVAVRGVMLATRAWKTDAGDAQVRTGVISGASEAVSAGHAISMAPVWYSDVFEVDPATEVAWTLEAINDLETVLERND